MNSRRSPLEIPEWHALRREASLASQLIGTGATALSKASYANGLGEYYTAFFGLSIGIERLGKLILVVDHALKNGGTLPNQNVIKSYGHKIAKIVEEITQITVNRDLRLRFSKPDNTITAAIIHCLDSFADGSKGRYANFSTMANSMANNPEEPVAKWWQDVVETILQKHYYDTTAEAKVKNNAKIIDYLIGDFTLVSNFNESSARISDVETASERTGQTHIAQKYGRFYTLSIVRWLADVFEELTRQKGYEPGFEALYCHYEFFLTYCCSDRFLLTRNRWPLK